MDTQRCARCKKDLPATTEFFHRMSGAKSGLHSYCKACRSNENTVWSKANRDKKNATYKKYHDRVRLEVLTAYCDGVPKCQCCGDTHLEFLSLDHRNGDGAAHRREFNGGKQNTNNRAVYRWARKNGYPNTLWVLCHNCNRARHMYGECPHERERRSETWR